jgi:hypothetical protein
MTKTLVLPVCVYRSSGVSHLYCIPWGMSMKVKRKQCRHPRGAVVRTEAHTSSDPCVPGSNSTVGRGCGFFG